MKKGSTRISANEINRFMYCQNQWYYKRIYGAKALGEMYKELGIESSKHESNFEKGMKYHTHYHFKYRLVCLARWVVLILILFVILRMVGQWIQ